MKHGTTKTTWSRAQSHRTKTTDTKQSTSQLLYNKRMLRENNNQVSICNDDAVNLCEVDNQIPKCTNARIKLKKCYNPKVYT